MKALHWFEVGPMPGYVGIVFTKRAFFNVLKKLEVEDAVKEQWVGDGSAGANCLLLRKDNGDIVSLVSLDPADYEGRSSAQVAAILAHEAVHVWQYMRDEMKEHKPGAETEAWVIQYYTQRFIIAYEEFTGDR